MRILFCVLLFSGFCFGEVIHGVVSSKDGFAFLGKFCFDWDPESFNKHILIGEVHIRLKKRKANEKVKDLDILEYDDQADSWPMVYDRGYKDLTCAQKRSYARDWRNNSGNALGNYQVKWNLNNAFSSTKFSIYEHLRPRFWYYAIANCEPFEEIAYTIEFKNTRYSAFNQQFGRDIKGLNTLFLFFAPLYIILAVFQSLATFEHWNTNGYLHPIIKLFGASFFFQFIAVIFYAVYYLKFSLDGEHSQINIIAKVSEIFGRVILILMLCLLSRGWTISTEYLSGKNELLFVCLIFLMLQIVILIWQSTIENPAATEIPVFYEVCLQLLNLVWIAFGAFFVLSIYNSYKSERNTKKKDLYLKLAVFYGPWMISLPVSIILTIAVAPWDRELAVTIFHSIVTFLANTIMIYLVWPSRALDYFSIALPKINYAPTVGEYEINSDFM